MSPTTPTDPSRAAPHPSPPPRRASRVFIALACALLANAGGLSTLTSAQGTPCLVETDVAHVCPPPPQAPDPAAAAACMADAADGLAGIPGEAITETAAAVTAAVNAVLVGDLPAANATLEPRLGPAEEAEACCPCPPPCGQYLVSDPATVWTHYNQLGTNEGFRQPAVAVANPYPWGAIPPASGGPAPQFIWSHPGSGNPSSHDPTRLPVMFERFFTSCIYNPNGLGQQNVVLRVKADDAFLVVFNGQVLAPSPPCNGQSFSDPDHNLCFTQTHLVNLPPLVNAGANAPDNHLVIYVWNHQNNANPNPGMLMYRLEY